MSSSRLSRSLLLSLLSLSLVRPSLEAQPKMVQEKKQVSYQVGDRIDPDTFVLGRDGETEKLLELIDKEAKLVVLVLFGGGVKTAPNRDHFRGGLWCEDSFDDLAVQRAAVHTFKNEPVQFIGIAVPPIFHANRFGWEKEAFRGEPSASSSYQEAEDVFIENTDQLRESGLIPYEDLYFDPRFRLSMNQKEEMGSGYGTIYPWQGKLKWHKDPRTYGTPTIWFLSAGGTVLAEPLFGNDYDGEPPEIQYGFAELRDRIQELLAHERSR